MCAFFFFFTGQCGTTTLSMLRVKLYTPFRRRVRDVNSTSVYREASLAGRATMYDKSEFSEGGRLLTSFVEQNSFRYLPYRYALIINFTIRGKRFIRLDQRTKFFSFSRLRCLFLSMFVKLRIVSLEIKVLVYYIGYYFFFFGTHFAPRVNAR